MKETNPELLLHAAEEIARLRQRNELLSAQISVVETFRAALLGPAMPMGAGVDIAWELKREAKRLADAILPKEDA